MMRMKMFRERNPLPLGIAVVAWVLALVLVVLNLNTIIGAFGRPSTAELPEAAGLKQGDPVLVSGVDVGRVSSVELGAAGGGVLAEFTLNDGSVHLGSLTSASVSVQTVLGDKALVLTSAGDGELDEGSTIPLSRTSAPYDVNDALTDLTQETGRIDVGQVARALDTVSDTLDAARPDIGAAFRGVSRLSATIGSRDTALRRLLDHADAFSRILADRSGDLTRLIRDGNTLFRVLSQRREEIRSLLINVSALSRQLSAFVGENQKELGPALDQLNQVSALLQRNKTDLSDALRGAAVYATGLGEVVASGPYFTAYLQNLLPGNLVPPALDLSEFGLGGAVTSKGAGR